MTDGSVSTAAKITVGASDAANIVVGNKYTTIEGLNTSIYVRSMYLNADLQSTQYPISYPNLYRLCIHNNRGDRTFHIKSNNF